MCENVCCVTYCVAGMSQATPNLVTDFWCNSPIVLMTLAKNTPSIVRTIAHRRKFGGGGGEMVILFDARQTDS